MPYIDRRQQTNDIGHCRRCDFQWVVAEGARGQRGNTRHTYNGKVCPFCRSKSIYYTQEDNR